MGLLLGAAGCAASASDDDAPASPSNGALTVTADDAFRFSPAHLTIRRCDVTIRLVASGSYPHNIAVPQLHETSKTVSTSIGDPHTTLLQLHDVRPGVYRFVCTFHSKAGMTGELVVR